MFAQIVIDVIEEFEHITKTYDIYVNTVRKARKSTKEDAEKYIKKHNYTLIDESFIKKEVKLKSNPKQTGCIRDIDKGLVKIEWDNWYFPCTWEKPEDLEMA